MFSILIVEDDENIARMIRIALSMGNYTGTICDNGEKVMQFLQEGRYDLILLDVMLPGKDGFQIMEEIHPLGIPVIFLTAKQEVMDKVNGLKLGAEDYIVKPFESMELLARIEVVLRRFHKQEEEKLTYGSMVVIPMQHEVLVDGHKVELTPREFEVLEYFLKHKDIVIRKETLMAAVIKSVL